MTDISAAMPAPPAEPLPPVERVRPGLWSVPVPIPINPLRYVLVYAFETDDGPVIVDAGWNTEEAWTALCDGLAEAGFDIARVRGVLVTHIHPDHYGLAGRVRDASGAWVALHPADAALVHDRYEAPDDLLDRIGLWLRRMGAPPDDSGMMQFASMGIRNLVTPVPPDVLLEDFDEPEVPGWDLVALWTPGHSPGHLCFYERGHRLMLSGDHVLPRITPNIGVHPQAPPDPLGDYLASLRKVADYETDEVLPAHEHRFTDLRGRVQALIDHHEARFVEALGGIDDGLTTTWEIAGRLTWSTPWASLPDFMRRAALGEAMAHLRALEARGLVWEEEGEPSRWRRSDAGAALHS